jgi:hypothetical protein
MLEFPFAESEDYMEKVEAIQYTQDPLACILALSETYHVSQVIDRMRAIGDLISTKKVPHRDRDRDNYQVCVYVYKKLGSDVPITDEHQEKSEQIRRYYGRKLFLNRMKGNPPLSGFRRTLEKILTGYNDQIIEREELKILAKLPEFYAADQYMDWLADTYDCDPANYKELVYPRKKIGHLPFIGELCINTRLEKIRRFFFLYDHDKIVALDVQGTNNLLPLLDKVVNTDSFVLDEGAFVGSKIRATNYGFYRLTDWTLC